MAASVAQVSGITCASSVACQSTASSSSGKGEVCKGIANFSGLKNVRGLPTSSSLEVLSLKRTVMRSLKAAGLTKRAGVVCMAGPDGTDDSCEMNVTFPSSCLLLEMRIE